MDKRLMAETHLAQGPFWLAIGFSLGGGLAILLQAFLLSRIITRVFMDQASREDVTTLLGVLLVVIVVRSLFQLGVTITTAKVAIRVKQALRERLVFHLLQLGPAFTQQERSGELTTTATAGIEALDSFFRGYLPALFTAVLIPLSILGVVLPLDGLTFLVLLLTAPLIPIFMILIGMAAGALAQSQYRWLGQMSAHFLDVMQGLTTLKLFNRSQHQAQTIHLITDQFRQNTLNVLRVAFLSAFMLELMATLSIAVIAVQIGVRLLTGGIPFEQALFLLVIAPEFYMPMRELGAKFHTGRDSLAAADRIYTILNTPITQTTGYKKLHTVTQIEFKQVTYTYAEQKQPALETINFTVKQGEHLALVGGTGSGKSTIANLLLGFIQPTAGEIIISDGEQTYNLNELDITAWRQQLAWVAQRSYLFNTSLAENIKVGNPALNLADVQTAATAAGADSFIQTFQLGYNTPVGENGVRLSGGQAQRVAVARALARDVPVYILDEATASLDMGNETLIQNNLKKHTHGRILITIAHRLNTIRDANQIVVLDQGRIVENGTHTLLLKTGGAYCQLWQAMGEKIPHDS